MPPKNLLDDPILRHHFWQYHGSIVHMDYMLLLGNIWVCYIITSPNLKFVPTTRERGSDICNLNFTMGLTNFWGTILIFMYLRYHKPFILIAMVHKFKKNVVKIKKYSFINDFTPLWIYKLPEWTQEVEIRAIFD